MRLRKITSLAAAGALALLPAAGHAQGDCELAAEDGSSLTPHASDPANDWAGPVLGDGNPNGAGDVWREGTDIIAAWLHRADDGSMTANVQVANLNLFQPNSIFYILWDYDAGGADLHRARRWVSGRLKGYGEAFTYGYHTTNPVTTNLTFFTMGDTTGTFTAGVGGIVSIDIPQGGTTLPDPYPNAPYNGQVIGNDDWGAPAPGSLLTAFAAETRVLIGSPEPLPPNPTGLRHGQVRLADWLLNAYFICDIPV